MLQATVTAFAQALMRAEADAVCGAGYGHRRDEWINSRKTRWDGTRQVACFFKRVLHQHGYLPCRPG
ncbi:hypothetical protein [Micromonospora musae]|uniref:hypothetical protein n=1 Tax=Micromonospora musae TaxID=1894970 RepID=UPI003F4D0FA3